MAKRMLIMLVLVGALFGAVFGFKAYMARKTEKQMAAAQMPPVTVSTTKAEVQPWQTRLAAVGNLRAVRGVDVTSEVAGLVRTVEFRSGDDVKEGQRLVQLNADADVALLRSLEAAAELAAIVYERDKKQFDAQVVSQATMDTDAGDLKSKRAQAAAQAAVVEKKAITAPFDGRLGITTVNPGQYIDAGTMVVTLQSLDPIYVDFYLPQQQVASVSPGQTVSAATDAFPGRAFAGKVTAINPKVDPATRNIRIEATLANPGHELLPGMYASVDLETGAPRSYVTLPQTVVSYNPYGDTVYIVVEGGKGPDGKPTLIVKQTFVTVGPTRGDQVAILSGVKEGDVVVTSGQLKLRNGSPVVINNKVQPSNDPNPQPAEG